MTNTRRDEAKRRAAVLAAGKDIRAALRDGSLEQFQDISLSEALVLGLLTQGVRKFVGVFGHGSTDLGEMLAVYEAEGAVRFWPVRHETEAAHCVSMLRWRYGETGAVVTSIGPGALNAFAGSIASASNGLGVYHIYGDETSHDEGPNMQRIPKPEQATFLELVKTMGRGYQLHTPEAVFTGLRNGATTVFNPVQAGPFFFLLPMNVQPQVIRACNLLEFPVRPGFPGTVVGDEAVFESAIDLIQDASRIVIKLGGGSAGCGRTVMQLAELIDAVVVSGPKMSGVVPYGWARHMGVGGSKGSLCGNYAMNEADLVLLVGGRGVCQWDCSGTAWKKARHIINFNADPFAANHYNRSLPVLGDAEANIRELCARLAASGFPRKPSGAPGWLEANTQNKRAWAAFKQRRFDNPVLFDTRWGRDVLTQPAAIRLAYDFARAEKAACYFDAGDVQANGFQIAEDEAEGTTFSETGSSYMGFAVSALLASALADRPGYAFAFTGDGSFTMNPQIIFDGVEHGVRGCILLFDNRRMAAISGLQQAQYGRDYKTSDDVRIDYVRLAAAVEGIKSLFGGYSPDDFVRALREAHAYDGLSVIHVPVYYGEHELGGLGAFGSWNVGNWCEEVQREHHRIGL